MHNAVQLNLDGTGLMGKQICVHKKAFCLKKKAFCYGHEIGLHEVYVHNAIVARLLAVVRSTSFRSFATYGPHRSPQQDTLTVSEEDSYALVIT